MKDIWVGTWSEGCILLVSLPCLSGFCLCDLFFIHMEGGQTSLDLEQTNLLGLVFSVSGFSLLSSLRGMAEPPFLPRFTFSTETQWQLELYTMPRVSWISDCWQWLRDLLQKEISSTEIPILTI